ncbi:MAG: phosphoribosylaminoimidazolesuccinocarboxamide synthase [Pyrinomonadaceae bacterium]|nr:phosphoribosylaminoimidazolesuccinocarboxamide synthase [Pyrinomonadaceae bacterium]
MTGTVATTQIDGLTLINRGKVRDIYSVDDDSLLIVATDRISAFDCIMPNQIPYKGRVLTAISAFWFEFLSDVTGNHLISCNLAEMPETVRRVPELEGRSMLVKRADVFPVECVVRGYLEGSGWKDYQKTGSVCGHALPVGMKQCDRLPEPIFTPATKAESGHDENIDFDRFRSIIGTDSAYELRDLTMEIYRAATKYAESKGIMIADTKFEFGRVSNGDTILIDEVLTPDSSRFWEASEYQPGRAQASFDKQFLREYLETLDWDKTPPAPHLPEEIVEATSGKYLEAYKRLTGSALEI